MLTPMSASVHGSHLWCPTVDDLVVTYNKFRRFWTKFIELNASIIHDLSLSVTQFYVHLKTVL